MKRLGKNIVKRTSQEQNEKRAEKKLKQTFKSALEDKDLIRVYGLFVDLFNTIEKEEAQQLFGSCIFFNKQNEQIQFKNDLLWVSADWLYNYCLNEKKFSRLSVKTFLEIAKETFKIAKRLKESNDNDSELATSSRLPSLEEQDGDNQNDKDDWS